ncbi:MAG: T9SS type A sorting domain-containing protein, partial [Bacteroidota bacterium]
SLVDFTLPETGSYTINVREDNGDKTSNYWLSLQCREDLITTADTLKNELGSFNAQIPNPGYIQAYLFLVNKSDTTEIVIERNNGSFEPDYQLMLNDSIIYSQYNSNKLIIPDSCFEESGQYILFVSDYMADETGEYQFSWKGITQNIVLISDILSHQDVYNLGDEITPKAVIKNIGWENVTAQLRLKIFETYDEKVDNITLLPGQEKTLELKNWTPFSEGSFTGIWTTENNLGYGGDFYNERFCVTDGKGPEIYSVSPETGANGGDFTLTITGKAFQAGLKAALFNDDYPSGRIAENSDINYLSSDSIEATFDLSNVPESKFHVKIINPDDSTFVFYEGFMVTQFNGKELTLNTWEEIEIAAGTQEVYGINITDQTENLFFLVKKATKIGHHGTWTGGMRVFRQGTLIADESGTQDYDFHFKNMPPGRYYIEVWSQQEAEAQIKVGDHVDKLTFGEWHKGLVLKGWGSDWTQIDVPENTDSLYFETQGFGIYSNLQIFYDSLGNKENYHYFDDYKKGNHLSGSIANPVPGRYYLKYMDSDNVVGGDSQERDYLINVDIKSIEESEPLKPIITSLSTYEGGKSDIVTITIVGSGLDSLSTVYLIRDGYMDVPADSIIGNSSKKNLIAVFNLSTTDLGEWSLKVLNPDGQVATSAKKFNVISENNKELWINIIGRNKIRIGRWQNYIISFGNNGTVDAGGVITLQVPNGIHCKIYYGQPVEETSTYVTINKVPLTLWTLVPAKESRQIVLGLLIPSKLNSKSVNINLNDLDEINAKFKKSNWLARFFWKFFAKRQGEIIYHVLKGNGFNVDPNEMMEWNNEAVQTFADFQKNNPVIVQNPADLSNWAMRKKLYDNSDEMLRKKPQEINDAQQEELQDLTDEAEYSLPFEDVSSSTPEDKYGTTGIGVSHYVSNFHKNLYKIDFWNHDTATANAQEVFILDTLDINFNDTTLNFTEFGFLRWKVPLQGGQYFNVNVDMRPDMNLRVNVEGKYEPDSREISYIFRSLDPNTLDYPEDPLAGFLPPIDSTGYQIGWVEYEVEPNKDLPDSTILKNQAWVNFDGVGPTNPAPKEGPWTNMIDAVPPESFVESLPALVNEDSVLVKWQGTDSGSGVKNYTIYFSENNIDFTPWLSNFAGDSSYFYGETGKTYYFYSIAKDNVGITEPPKTNFEAMVQFEFETGINEIVNEGNDGDILIYPNPTECCFRVVSGLNCTSSKTIVLFNSMGQKILQKQYDSKEITIDLSNQAKGIYYVNVSCENSQANEKIIIY